MGEQRAECDGAGKKKKGREKKTGPCESSLRDALSCAGGGSRVFRSDGDEWSGDAGRAWTKPREDGSRAEAAQMGRAVVDGRGLCKVCAGCARRSGWPWNARKKGIIPLCLHNNGGRRCQFVQGSGCYCLRTWDRAGPGDEGASTSTWYVTSGTSKPGGRSNTEGEQSQKERATESRHVKVPKRA